MDRLPFITSNLNGTPPFLSAAPPWTGGGVAGSLWMTVAWHSRPAPIVTGVRIVQGWLYLASVTACDVCPKVIEDSCVRLIIPSSSGSLAKRYQELEDTIKPLLSWYLDGRRSDAVALCGFTAADKPTALMRRAYEAVRNVQVSVFPVPLAGTIAIPADFIDLQLDQPWADAAGAAATIIQEVFHAFSQD